MYQSISGLMSKLGVSEDTTARSVSSQIMDHGMDPGLDLDAIIRCVRVTNNPHANFIDLLVPKVRPISRSWTRMRHSTLATGLKPGPDHKTTFTGFLVLAGTTTTSTTTMTRSEWVRDILNYRRCMCYCAGLTVYMRFNCSKNMKVRVVVGNIRHQAGTQPLRRTRTPSFLKASAIT
jgi:hypothetical protein